MNGLYSKYDLDVIPLGSYDVLIGMDWLESHHVILDFHNKIVTCLDEDGNTIQVKGIPKPISRRQTSTMQMKKYLIKQCQIYAIHAEEVPADMQSCIEGILVLQKF